MLQDDLAIKYKYKPLPKEVSEKAKKEYFSTIPVFFKNKRRQEV